MSGYACGTVDGVFLGVMPNGELLEFESEDEYADAYYDEISDYIPDYEEDW